jgi:alkylhydroperoxidase/carboxymuconolactone decarboxylase family protein YurZ
MPTLPLPDPTAASGRAREVLELAARRNGQPLEGLSHILRVMAYWPEWLEVNLGQTAATFKGAGVLPPLTRECLHIAAAAGARLGMTSRGFAEVVAVAEHVAGQARSANLLGLLSEGGLPPLVAPVDPEAVEGPVRATLDEIRAWAREALGWDEVPLFWRAIARQPRYLNAAWAKTKLVLGPAEIDREAKIAVALACAALAGSRYFVEYYQAAYRRLGFDDAAVVELAGLVNHYASFNTVSHAFQLESPGEAEFAPPQGEVAAATSGIQPEEGSPATT